MTKTDDPIQAQLSALRRSQILEAAARVFAEKGFHRATIKEIAQAAGVADGTIYNYFDSKPALLLGLLDRLNETRQREPDLRRGLAEDFRGFFTGYLRHRLAVLQPNRELLQAALPELLANASLREQYYRQMVQPSLEAAAGHFRARIAQGQMRPVDPALTARALAGLVLGLQLLHLLGDETPAADGLPEALADILFDGLTPGVDR
jgi:AcrR family transcriptional regulator